MSLNELINLAILIGIAVLIGIEIGKKQRRPGMTWHELGEMMRELEKIMNTPHGSGKGGPDPFAEDASLEHGAVTTVKRPDYDEAKEQADSDREFMQDVATTERGEIAVEGVVGPPPAIDGTLMTLEERADALRVHIGNIQVVSDGSGNVTALVHKRPSIYFTREEAMQLVAEGDAVGTVVAV